MESIPLIIQLDEEEPGAAEVLVDGTIGPHKYRFLLDTGAARTSVAADDYTSTFASSDANPSSGVFEKHVDDLITVPSIQVGPITRRGFTLARKADARRVVRNLIGMDLLKDFVCHFRFDENRLLLVADQDIEAKHPLQELFLDAKSHPYVDVLYGQIPAAAVWDTGAGLTVVDLGFVRKHAPLFQDAGTSIGTDSTGHSMETPMFQMAASTIGGRAFPALRVAGVDLAAVNATLEVPMDLILGYNALNKANWLFDFPGRRWTITKMLAAA